jgi:hypothetical protein
MRTRAPVAALLLGGVVTLGAVEASAQVNPSISFGPSAALSALRMDGFGQGLEELSGTLIGAEGSASLWLLLAQGEYRQGDLDRDGPDGSSRVVLARASAGLQPVPWFAITTGPSFWTVGAPGGNRRTIRWRVDAHTSRMLIEGIARGFVSAGVTVAGTEFDWEEPLSGGGRAGLVVGEPGGLVWGSLSFRMDREWFEDGLWQTVQTTALSVGVTLP